MGTSTSSWAKEAADPIAFSAEVSGREVCASTSWPEVSPAKSSAMPWIIPPPMSSFLMSAGVRSVRVHESKKACEIPFRAGSSVTILRSTLKELRSARCA